MTDETQRYIDVAGLIKTAVLTQQQDSELVALITELVELKYTGAGDAIDLRIQDDLVPLVVCNSEKQIWSPLLECLEPFEQVEAVQELPNFMGKEIYEELKWSLDEDLRADLASALGIVDPDFAPEDEDANDGEAE